MRLGGRRQVHADRQVARGHRQRAARPPRAGAAGPQGRLGRAAGRDRLLLLTDGLEAEREQGITIDVAYRFLDLLGGRRRVVIADAPGHDQHGANMAVAASTADLAVLYAKANSGTLPSMTGVGQSYEPPEAAEVVLDGTGSLDKAVARLVTAVTAGRYVF